MSITKGVPLVVKSSVDINKSTEEWVQHIGFHSGNKAILHMPPSGLTSPNLFVMVGGAGGGMHGPAESYSDIGDILSREGITAARVDYLNPNETASCVRDVQEAVKWIDSQTPNGIKRVILMGWSFGGAVVITSGAAIDKVIGVVTIASQTAGTADAPKLGPAGKSLLLIHGTKDMTLPDRCSSQIYSMAKEPKELVFYNLDNHGITKHRAEMIATVTKWALTLFREKAQSSA